MNACLYLLATSPECITGMASSSTATLMGTSKIENGLVLSIYNAESINENLATSKGKANSLQRYGSSLTEINNTSQLDE